MGIVKLMLPRFMYYRNFLPYHKDWRRNSILGFSHILVSGFLLEFAFSRWKFRSPLVGTEMLDPAKQYSRPIPILQEIRQQSIIINDFLKSQISAKNLDFFNFVIKIMIISIYLFEFYDFFIDFIQSKSHIGHL